MRLILPLVILTMLAGCGLKDDLYLPDDTATSAADETREDDRAEDS
ncbi:MAG: lipoprotein [Wenzhouxiangella sp.]|nr:lipoprotein [Wenzhouxiangella sp.]MCH8477463.1 lipoprotein [Wenzhouxiangella sp.]TVR96944.1 MAG: lipopeptide [Wenzhouxiangellaceae bacterium]